LSLVQLAEVPLCLIAGPACDVWTTSARTEDWFNDALVSNLPQAEEDASHKRAGWQQLAYQSNIGVLTEVIDGLKLAEPKSASNQILFYAIVDHSQDRKPSPTPPRSSSNGNSINPSELLSTKAPVIRVQALPLHSDFLSFLPSPPQSPATNAVNNVRFLPSIEEMRTEAIATEKKRKRVDEVFNSAAQEQKKARRKGYEGIAAATSNHINITTLVGQKKPKAPQYQRPDEAKCPRRPSISQAPNPKNDASAIASPILNARPHSRSPSFSSDTRPPSRRGLLDNNAKRSSLSRVTSLSESSTVEDRNKEMISRLVMASMRLYGMQRKKPGHSRKTSEIITHSNALSSGVSADASREETAKDDEYKLMYHQTYKAAVFAFVSSPHNFDLPSQDRDANDVSQRKQISMQPLYLSPEPLRECVDKLLDIFCSDPMAEG